MKKIDKTHSPRCFLRKFVALAIALTALQAQARSTRDIISMSVSDATVASALRQVNTAAGSNIVNFRTQDVAKTTKRVTTRMNDVTVLMAVNTIIDGTDLRAVDRTSEVLVVPANAAATATAAYQTQTQQPVAAQGRVTGRVTDAGGNPISGVSVIVKNTQRGTSTDAEGRYVLRIDSNERPDETPALIFSMMGMQTREIAWTGQQTLNVTLSEAVHQTEEVVVTGYGDISSRNYAGSVVTKMMTELDVAGITTVDELLEGRIPGLFYTQTSGQPGATPRLRVRGTSTIVGNQQPLLVVDGIVQADPVNIDPATVNDPDFVNLLGNAIMGINPGDIERVDVLKDAAATALYGARAANGIIVLTTKKGEAGPPKFSYRFDASMSLRPRYTDRGFNMMNSAERVDLSRELIEKGVGYGAGGYTDQWSWPGYEGAWLNYNKYGTIDYNEFQRLTNYYETLNTDWLDVLTRNTLSQNHMVSVNGGSQASRYYVSLGYADEQGNIRGEQNKRYSTAMRLNTTHGRFNAQFGMQGSINNKNYVPTELGVMNYAQTMNRAIGLYNEDGSLWYYPRSGRQGHLPYNIRNEMDNSSQSIDQNMLSLNTNLQYRLNDKIRIQAVGSFQLSDSRQEEWFGENSFHSANLRGDGGTSSLLPFGGVLTTDGTSGKSWTARAQADYSDHFGASEKHFFNAMLVGELSSSRYDQARQEHRGYFADRGKTFPTFTDLNTATYPSYYTWLAQSGNPTFTESLTNLASLIASANYIYDGRYVLNLSTRSDWSNAFGSRSNEKFMPIWSVAGRWNIDSERFLQKALWIDLLALRLSYGTQGNMHTNQPTTMTITKGAWNDRYGSFTSTVRNYPNPDLKWERTNSYNAGVDFSLWGEKLKGSVEYYYKKTTDALLSRRVSSVNGVSQYVVNSGDVSNQGIELSLNFKPIDQGMSSNGRRGWVWRIDPQIGQAVNQLISRSLSASNAVLQDEISLNEVLEGKAYIAGKPLSTFYSFKYAGLNNLGRPTFVGLEEERQLELIDIYSAAAAQDEKEVWWMLLDESGTREPVLQGGISNYVAYRNFSLSFNLSYSLGNKLRMLQLHSAGSNNPMPHENVRAEFVYRWRNPGDEVHTDIPAVGTGLQPGWWSNLAWSPKMSSGQPPSVNQMYDYSDLRVVSGNYLKLQSITLRYALEERLLKKLGVSYADISLVGTNLFTLCDKKLKGQDPTQFGSTSTINITPRPTFSMSLNVNF